MKDRIIKSIGWMVWSRVVIQAVTFFSTLWIARLLLPADYGLMALAGMWTGIVGLLAEIGMGAAIVQFKDMEESELDACFWLTIGMALIGYLALFFAAPYLAHWFDSPKLSEVLRIAGLALPILAVRVVPDSLLRKRLALNKISQAEIIANVLTVPVMLVMASLGAGVWTLVAGILLIAFVQTCATFWFVRWRPRLRAGGKNLREVIRYSIHTLGTRISWTLYQQADVFVLGKVLGEGVLGFYSMAQQIATLPVNKISAVVNQLSIPIMAELQADRDAMKRALLRGLSLVVSLTFPICAGLFFVAEDLVRVTLTEKWVPAVPVLQILCIYAAIKSIDVLFPPVLMARYRTTFLFGYTLVLLLIMPLAFWAGAHWYGAVGVASSWALIYPLIMFTMARVALKEIGVSASELFRQLWPALAGTVVMICFLLIFEYVLASWPKDLTLYRLIIMTLVGIITYVGAAYIFNTSVWTEIREMFTWVMPRRNGLEHSALEVRNPL